MASVGISLLMIGGAVLELVGLAAIVMCAVYLRRIVVELKSYRSAVTRRGQTDLPSVPRAPG